MSADDNTEFLRAAVKRSLARVEASGPAGHRADKISVPTDDLLPLLMAVNEAILAREAADRRVTPDRETRERFMEAVSTEFRNPVSWPKEWEGSWGTPLLRNVAGWAYDRLLASGVLDTTPLDPKPWVYQDGERWAIPSATDDEQPRFEPGDEYEQDRARYVVSGVLDGTSKESAPVLTGPGDVSNPLPGVLSIPADQATVKQPARKLDTVTARAILIAGILSGGRAARVEAAAAVDEWMHGLAVQRTADRETIARALWQNAVRTVKSRGQGVEFERFEDIDAESQTLLLSDADAVLAVLVPADLIRAETLGEAQAIITRQIEVLIRADISVLVNALGARAAEYWKQGSA